MAKNRQQPQGSAAQPVPSVSHTGSTANGTGDQDRSKHGRMPSPEDIPFQWRLSLALAAVFFLIELLTNQTTIKILALVLIPVTIVCCVIRLSVLETRVTIPMLAVTAWVVMNGVSMFYGLSSKLALREFLRIVVGFCGFLLILAWSRRGTGQGRTVASVLEGATALASLISIDMISTRLLSGLLFQFLSLFSQDYSYVMENPLEAGIRINSLYENPNVFASIAGLAVILGLETSLTSGEKRERRFHLICLYLNALACLLVFSMGASAFLALAFLVLLLVERKERKGALLLLMIETFGAVIVAVIPIYLTSFRSWSGIQPVPLLCAVAGAVLLCGLDHVVGHPLGAKLGDKAKLVYVAIVVVLGVMAAYVFLAINLTGPAKLAAGENLRRAAYPVPGRYALDIDATAPVTVSIESQNRAETMMHTETTLYQGKAQGATFTVPGDSEVVYFRFSSSEDLTLESATYTGDSGHGRLPLNYLLLPGFIANRLQGLFANENAIQRTVFFDDGLKLFAESPLIGQGLGAFDAACRHVQSFDYGTK